MKTGTGVNLHEDNGTNRGKKNPRNPEEKQSALLGVGYEELTSNLAG